MNDFGFALAWLAMQVALVLTPALVLNGIASRRQPSSGAWVATWSLGLSIVLGLMVLIPRIEAPATADSATVDVRSSVEPIRSTDRQITIQEGKNPDISEGPRGKILSFTSFQSAWSRWQLRAAEPAARFRPWGRVLAFVALAGSGLGLVRLGMGLWAVGHCRRRGRIVDDAALIGLVEDLKRSMDLKRAVEIREIADLATPATAGWRRPMILLPDNWRSWSKSELRAVLAHELAHIIRGDYASTMLARAAVILHAYHPMVRWMAGRLHLQQELAADAIGAQFSGGRTSYLLALSSLALKQDGRSPSWPARAFLPARGTLIRRIKMLRIEKQTQISSKSWSQSKRLATALAMVALTLGAASLKRPVKAADDKPEPAPAKSTAVALAVAVEPFEMGYISDGMPGVIGLRPAALARRIGVEKTNAIIDRMVGGDLTMLAKQLGLDMSRPGFIRIGVEDIDSITFGFKIGYQENGPKNENGENLQRIEFSTFTIKTVDAFDWPKFFRQWKAQLEEIREPKGVYYKFCDPSQADLFMLASFFQPDSRTLIFEYEPRIKTLIANGPPQTPAHLRGADWDRVSRNLIAVAINNKAGAFAKGFDPKRWDDKAILQYLNGVENWFVGVPDQDRLSFHVTGNCPKAEDRNLILKTFADDLKNAREQLSPAGVGPNELAVLSEMNTYLRVGKSLIEKIRFEERQTSLEIHAEDFGKFADIQVIFNEFLALEGAAMQEQDNVKAAKPEGKATKP